MGFEDILLNGYQPRKQENKLNVPSTDSNVEDIGCRGCGSKILKLCSDKGYDPVEIGCAVLSSLGFDVKRYLKGDISVSDNLGNLLYFSDLPDYEP